MKHLMRRMQIGEDQSAEIQARVQATVKRRTPLSVAGADTKAFLGRETPGEPLAVTGHRGIVNYAPEELVLTARSGTLLTAIEALLAEHNQMLAFEPPHFGVGATLGGTVAANLSGPRRAYAGAARDFVLGMRIINGRGQILRLGGEVMKNVAGYDLSRLMAGSMGTLGVILDISLKVLPRPREEMTLVQETAPRAAVERLCRWALKPLPISASCIESGRLYVRLSGASSALGKSRAVIGGEVLDDAAPFWSDVREQRHQFFNGAEQPLWRVSLPPASEPLELPGEQIMEWGGALRWLKSSAGTREIRSAVAALGGHAMLFRTDRRANEPYHPLPEPLMRIHKAVKQAIDPYAIFNRGRMYADL
jgi:glycolate oxidase FAD binding subunit